MQGVPLYKLEGFKYCTTAAPCKVSVSDVSDHVLSTAARGQNTELLAMRCVMYIVCPANTP